LGREYERMGRPPYTVDCAACEAARNQENDDFLDVIVMGKRMDYANTTRAIIPLLMSLTDGGQMKLNLILQFTNVNMTSRKLV
jgi:hypothetical protein